MGEAELEACRELVRHHGADSKMRKQVAAALLQAGALLRELGRPDEAIGAYADLVRRFPSGAIAARGFYELGTTLGEAGRHEDAIAALTAVRGPLAAQALVRRALELAALGQVDEEIRVYDQVVRNHRDEPEWVGKALFNKALALERAGRGPEALGALAAVAERFGEHPDPAVRVAAAQAHVQRGILLTALDRPIEALDAYADATSRYALDPAIREPVVRAFVNTAALLARLGRPEEAIDVCAGVLDTYLDPDAAVEAQTRLARELAASLLARSSRRICANCLREITPDDRAVRSLHAACAALVSASGVAPSG
jgi:tetratricopeptide (TPR) repeat protein